MSIDNKKWTCASCKETFEFEWTEEEALKEKEEHFGTMPLEKMVRVCDDCFVQIMKFNNHPIGENKCPAPSQFE